MGLMREGADRWRSRTTQIRRHPTLRAWITIVVCLAVLLVAASYFVTYVIDPLMLRFWGD